MAEYQCRLANSTGEIITTSFSSTSEGELRHRLSEQGYYIYSIHEKGKGLALGLPFVGRKKKIKIADFMIFNQQFVALIHAGLPILKALDLLIQRVKDVQFRQILSDIATRVKSGALLSEAFEAQGVFPKVYTASLYAGEKSGNLEEVIRRFLEYQKVINTARSKIRSALTYPIILTLLLVTLVTYLLTNIVPQFALFYSNLGAELPVTTQILIAISSNLRSQLLTGVFIIMGLIIGIAIWAKSPRGGLYFDGLKLRLPLMGEVWKKFSFSQMCRTLSTLLSGGIPMVNSLEVVADSSGNRVIAQAIESAIVSVREGQSLSHSLESSPIVPELAIEMVQVGESTGALSEMLRHVADFFDEEVNTRLNQLMTYIEPILLVILAVIVAFVLIALYLPIFNLGSTMHM
jgi:type IV pilus assembly protein PilC